MRKEFKKIVTLHIFLLINKNPKFYLFYLLILIDQCNFYKMAIPYMIYYWENNLFEVWCLKTLSQSIPTLESNEVQYMYTYFGIVILKYRNNLYKPEFV